MKTHAIFGSGLIGGYIGGVLAANHQDLVLVGRGEMLESLRDGLHLTDYQQHEAQVNGLTLLESTQLGHCQPVDVLWLCVKCTAVEQVLEQIKPLVGKDTWILCCQNGLGSDEAVKRTFADNRVLRVMVPFNVARPAKGHLHRGSEGNLTIESVDGIEAELASLCASIEHGLLPVTVCADMQALLWAKLQLNLSNSVNALADIPVKSMLEQRAYRQVIAALMSELLQVTDRLGIRLPKLTAVPQGLLPTVLRLPDFLFRLIANKMLAIDPTVRLSMWWDLKQGKKTEIDHLNGAILRAADDLAIACPANRSIVDLVRVAEQDNASGVNRQPMSGKTLLESIQRKG